MAWNPDKPEGFLGKLLGDAVYRANFGINYYDEGLIPFQTANGNGPGLQPDARAAAVHAGLAEPAGRTPAVHAQRRRRSRFPIPMSDFTFNRGFATTQEELKSPMIVNWTLGYQREIWRDAALEIRYVGNRGSNLWRFYNINETNIIENNFLQEFRNAQRNLAINVANGQTGFANNGLPGQVALPIFETAFGPRGSQPALAATAGFNNATFITNLQQRRGRPARQHARWLRRELVPVHVPPRRQRPGGLRVARLQRAGLLPDQFLPGEPGCGGPEQLGC